MELSKIHKLRISVEVKNTLKENKHKKFYVYNRGRNDLNSLIAKKAGIEITNNYQERGYIDIGEYIDLSIDELEHKEYRRINGDRTRMCNHERSKPDFKVSEELKALTKEFEEKQIPPLGPSKTLIGEMFRAIQYIQYRAHNDGDQPFIIGSPTFMSYMFLISKIDEFNYSGASWDEEFGVHEFNFTDPFVQEHSYEGRITEIIEHSLCLDADFIRYQLIDLLSNGKIKDEPNKFDSRDFSKLKGEYNY